MAEIKDHSLIKLAVGKVSIEAYFSSTVLDTGEGSNFKIAQISF